MRPRHRGRRALASAILAMSVAGGFSALSVPEAQAGQVVLIEIVSNGCGPGFLGSPGTGARLLDTQTFLNAHVNIFAKSYTVNFRPACDLHDAGYAGVTVQDRINGGTVDYLRWTQSQVDTKFLNDLRTLCRRTIPPGVALDKCLDTGGGASLGALSYYRAVSAVGAFWFLSDPARRGVLRNGAAPTTTSQPSATTPSSIPASNGTADPPAPPSAPTIQVTPQVTALYWIDNSTNELGFYVSDGKSTWRAAANQTSIGLGGVQAGLRVCLTVSSYNASAQSAWAPWACAISA